MASEVNSGSARFDSTEPGSSAGSPPGAATASVRKLNLSQTAASTIEHQPYGWTAAAPPGASVYPPAAAVSSTLNPRSCVTCRRRKVRCDKHMPCSNCRRAQISCVFPAPGRAPRRPRPKDPNAPPKQPSSERELELMKRLRKLEGIVDELSGQIELEAARHPSSSGPSPVTSAEADPGNAGRAASSPGANSQGQGSPAVVAEATSGAHGQRRSSFGLFDKTPKDVSKPLGRLVLNEKGASRYVSSGFWSKINDEIEEIRAATKDMTEGESDESDDESTTSSVEQRASSRDHQSFIFGYRSTDVDLRPLHPLPSQIPFMWQIYQDNVDPVVKILHVPTMNKLIRGILADSLDSLTPSTEALMFSIYYAAVTSMDSAEVGRALGADKSNLIAQYRFAVEQALAKANFLTDPDLTVCQAFVLFLFLVRRHDKFRFTWTLTSLAVRMCQAIGLHRDGTNFPNLKPFEVEMRRRLFWSLAMLDLRSAEDQGTDLTIAERSFDTKVPLNINDTDISPESAEFPQPRDGPTDITFSLIRYEICALARQIYTASSAMCPNSTNYTLATLEERERTVLHFYEGVERKYLKDGSAEENPMHWVMTNIARVVVAKMVMVIYQPVLFAGPVDRLSCRVRERLFIAAIEIFEYNQLLSTDPRSKQWRWLFRTYTQWHAAAYLLLEMCNRTWTATVERAWTALNAVFSDANGIAFEKMSGHAAVWLPFKKLSLRAKKHRDAEVARLRQDPNAARELDEDTRLGTPPSTFGALSGSVKSAIAHERWRKLVNAPPVAPGAAAMVPSSRCPRLRSLGPDTQQAQQTSYELRTYQADMQMADKELEDLVEQAISDPHFVPTAIFPLAFQGASTQNPGSSNMPATRETVFGYSAVDMPGVDHFASSPEKRQSPRTSAVVPLEEDDYPPAWLWRTEPVHKANQQVPDGADGAVEDMDINMDDGFEQFDWRNWQESLRGYQMETNGGATLGLWGTGL